MTKGVTVWFTGLSGSGKTTIAKRIETILQDRGVPVERLDGDIVRQSLTRDLGFSKEDRDKNIERVTFVSKLLTRNGVVTLCAFISPYKSVRDQSRREIGEFLEVYVKASMDALLERDLKGLYKKALAGEIQNFTGVNDPYDAPENPELVCDTDVESIEESTEKVLSMLEERGYIASDGSPKRPSSGVRSGTEKVAGPSTPHGGTLVNRELSADERAEAVSRAEKLYSVPLGDRELADVEMIGIGAMSPLTGLMRQLD
jgi:sulfate adenylyltransferase/3'-phosphoadenosine 5'-phosphosulfate synthase